MTINQSLFRKLPEAAEAACIFIGYVDELRFPISEFVRLLRASVFNDVTEVRGAELMNPVQDRHCSDPLCIAASDTYSVHFHSLAAHGSRGERSRATRTMHGYFIR